MNWGIDMQMRSKARTGIAMHWICLPVRNFAPPPPDIG